MENNHARKPTEDFEQFPEPKIKSIEVHIRRNETTGLGFNIVGGCDLPHIPGHKGIFVSKIRNNSPAYDDGRLHVGDRILTVNGIYLSDKTHDEAVEIFRNIDKECFLVVEPDAERILLSQPSNLIMPTCHSPSTNTARSRGTGSRASTPTRGSSPKSMDFEDSVSSKLNNELAKKLTSELNAAKEVQDRTKTPNGKLNLLPPLQDSANESPKLTDATHSMLTIEAQHAQPTVAPSAREPKLPTNQHNGQVMDHLQQPPKKPAGVDSSSPSIYSEILFISIGALTLGVGIFLGIRWYKRR